MFKISTFSEIDSLGWPKWKKVPKLPGPVVFPFILPKSLGKCMETPQKLCAYTDLS